MPSKTAAIHEAEGEEQQEFTQEIRGRFLSQREASSFSRLRHEFAGVIRGPFAERPRRRPGDIVHG